MDKTTRRSLRNICLWLLYGMFLIPNLILGSLHAQSNLIAYTHHESAVNKGITYNKKYSTNLYYSHSENSLRCKKEFTLPEANNIYVNDFANVLNQTEINSIKGKFTQLKSDQDIEITLITIQRLDDYHAGPNIEPFATALFNHWGVGSADKNNGVMILIAVKDRKMRIEIGKGYSSSWNNTMKQIIDNEFIPYFKNGDYQSGIENGVAKTISRLTSANNINQNSHTNKNSLLQIIWLKIKEWWFLSALPVIFGIIIKLRNIIRRRPRNCHRCNFKMDLLDEKTDNLHLIRGERLEEYLGSVDYFVRHCSQCEHIEIDRYKSWFSAYGACPECQFITVESESTVIRSATTSSTGLKQIDYSCKHCSYRDSENVTIPMKSESSSSSFGGGSSSGGGASGSW